MKLENWLNDTNFCTIILKILNINIKNVYTYL